MVFFAFLILAAQPSWSQRKATTAELQQEYNYKVLGAKMPEFQIRNFDSKLVSDTELKHFDRILFVLFNPSCEHCIEFTKELVQNAKEFKDVGVVYIAGKGMDEYLEKFIEETGLKLAMKGNIFIGSDQTRMANNASGLSEFLYRMYDFKLPQINLYSHDRIMTYRALGEVSMNKLLEELKKKN